VIAIAPPGTAAEREAAARLFFPSLMGDELAGRTLGFLERFEAGAFALDGWLCARSSGAIAATAVVQPLPSGSAVVLPPHGDPSLFDALAESMLAQLRSAGCHQAALFLDPGCEWQADPLVANGFRFVTEIQTRRREPLEPAPDIPEGFRLIPAQCDMQLFGKLLERTYEGTLDVPESRHVRPIKDVLAAAKLGQPEPPHWWILNGAGVGNIGIIQLAMVDGVVAELSYFGIIPEMRNRGLGAIALAAAMREAARSGSKMLSLCADVRNAPALRLYDASLFRTIQIQRLYLWHYS